ncbi:MAG: hypothetical protein JHC98_06290 [Thermoleophilaceae bacterium]|nr:hypothetical protein [Thermoleophilaceae bacterium]
MRSNPGLVKLPIYGGITAFIAFLVFGVPGIAIIAATNESNAGYVAGGILIAIGGYLSSFAIIYFNVALAAAADGAFRTGTADTSAGLAVARSHIKVIAQWAAVAALVSLFFNLLRERGGLVGQIAAGLGAAIWSLITFLIAPVLAFEGLGPLAAIKRSSMMFKNKWGQQITGDIAIGAISGLAMLLGILLAAGGVFAIIAGGAAVIAGGGLLLLGVVIVFGAAIVGGAVRGVFGVALYRYIVSEEVVGPFTAAEFEAAVKPKKGAKAQPAI